MTTMRMDLTSQEETLASLCEQAISEGGDLANWCLASTHDCQRFALDPKRKCSLPHESDAFYGEVAIAGSNRSVMGCRQRMSIGPVSQANSIDEIREFVMRDFLAQANWTYQNGKLGGFSIRKSIASLPSGRNAVFALNESVGPVDWRELSSAYRWVMLTIDLHDFVVEAGPIRKQIRQAVCVVQHPAFCSEDENPRTSRYRISVGYPFVPYAPLRNVFGFGPGKFGAAIKLYTFEIGYDDVLSVEMLFAAAPRCEKVLDFGRMMPDPIYGGARLVERLSFGKWSATPFHDWLDGQMLAQHCRVHQALIEGVAVNWRTRNNKDKEMSGNHAQFNHCT